MPLKVLAYFLKNYSANIRENHFSMLCLSKTPGEVSMLRIVLETMAAFLSILNSKPMTLIYFTVLHTWN